MVRPGRSRAAALESPRKQTHTPDASWAEGLSGLSGLSGLAGPVWEHGLELFERNPLPDPKVDPA